MVLWPTVKYFLEMKPLPLAHCKLCRALASSLRLLSQVI